MPASRSRRRCSLRLLVAARFSRTFASRFNFANVVFFLPAKVDLQVASEPRGPGRHDGDALSTVLRPADARPRPEMLAASTPHAPSAQRTEASLRGEERPRSLERQLQQRPSTGRFAYVTTRRLVNLDRG